MEGTRMTTYRERPEEKDYAWEIDQLVKWDCNCSFWFFNKDGEIFITDHAPEIKDDCFWLNGYISISGKVPEHLRKHWRESVRKKP